MLTIFSTPKAFVGHFGMIQHNAIASWRQLHPDYQILLLGNDEGTAEAANSLDVEHVPDVPRNEYGTPLLDGLFEIAMQRSSHPYLCYVNADIILLSDFRTALERVVAYGRPFLLIGRRWNLDVNAPLEFTPGWEERLREEVRAGGKLFATEGMDYFLHSRGVFGRIPPFAIGRTRFDNWLPYQARRRGAWFLDATEGITAIHQNHDYSHSSHDIYNGPEALRNQSFLRGERMHYTADHAFWVLTPEGIRRAVTPRRLYRRYHHWIAVRANLIDFAKRTTARLLGRPVDEDNW